MRKNIKICVLLFLIIAAGLFIRAVNINNAPPGVYPDETVNGIDAMNALTHGNWQWFYEANNGREGLFMNLIAICFKLFGVSVLTLKLPSIIFGTLTILGTYLLAKEIFSRRVGLISAFLVSTAFWAINFSRISFRANMLPTVLAFSFYFLFKGMRTKKWYDFAIGGLIFGIGLHTYIAFRIAPAILVVMFVLFLINRRGFLKEYWKHILAFLIFAFISAAPMLYTFFISHPEYLESRSANISILSPEINKGDLIGTFSRSLGLSLVKYNIWGDQNWRHNYPPYAILDPITGIAFTFGLSYSILRLVQLLFRRFRNGERHPRLEVYVFLVSWFFIMLAPEFLTAEGNPHALRSIGTLPAVFIIAALAFEYFFRKAEHYSTFFKKITVVLATFILLFLGTFNVIKYHFFWAKNPKTAESFEKNLMDVTDYLKTVPVTRETFIVAESMQRVPIQLFNWDRPNTTYVYSGQIEQIAPKTDNFIVILTARSNEAINYLESKFPAIQLEEKKDDLGQIFYTMKNK